MKTKEIAARYSIDRSAFEQFLYSSGLPFKNGMSIVVDDANVDDYVNRFRYHLSMLNAQAEADRQAELEKQRALSQMLISSGFSFEGYRIVRYSGYISGDDAVQIPRSGIFSSSRNGENLTNALVKIRRQALKELKEAAYDLGCNAVIGVDFDYITLEPETANFNGGTTYEPYVICVTANGNAVVIEKE